MRQLYAYANESTLSWWNTVSNVWYYFSNKTILEGEINDAKMTSFSSDFHAPIKHLNFFCILFMNY